MDIVSQVKQAINFTKEKDFNSAGKIYVKLLKQDKNNPTVLTLLGLLYLNIGKLRGAKNILLKAHKINPNNTTTIEALGFVMYNLGEFKKSCEYFEKIIKTTNNYEVFDKYINSLIDLRLYAYAYEVSSVANQKFPLNKDILASLIYSSIFTGKLNESIKYSNQLLKLYPKESKSWLRKGLIEEVIFHDENEAIKSYKKASQYGEKISAYYNLAISYNKTKDYKRALYYIKKVIKMTGFTANNSFILATIYFCNRKIRQGYKYYAQKDKYKDVDEPVRKLKNVWEGQRIKNKTLYVFADQGIGDCIMFSRFFPFLEKHFEKITIGIHPSLLKLCERSFKKYKKIRFIKYPKRQPKTDYSAIMSSLPSTLKMELDFPFSEQYMIDDNKKTKELKTKYFNTNKLKVGLCWEAGSAGIREQLNRTLHLSLFEDILKIPNIQFYSLQYKPLFNDYKSYNNIIDLGTNFKDFDDTASALKNLDVVITVDTSVAHLAGALGIKTFMLLPYCADWRWFNDTDTTPWYKSVKIFKQQDHVMWDKEMNDIQNELKKLL